MSIYHRNSCLESRLHHHCLSFTFASRSISSGTTFCNFIPLLFCKRGDIVIVASLFLVMRIDFTSPETRGTVLPDAKKSTIITIIFIRMDIILERDVSSDVTIRLYQFRSISIRFFHQQFDLDSIRFQFFYDLHTSVDPTRFVCGRVGMAVLRCWPPTVSIVRCANQPYSSK